MVWLLLGLVMGVAVRSSYCDAAERKRAVSVWKARGVKQEVIPRVWSQEVGIFCLFFCLVLFCLVGSMWKGKFQVS